MSSKREQIMAAIMAKLTPAGLGATVYRSRKEAVDRAEGNVAILEWVTDQATQNFHTFTEWRLSIAVTVFVRADAPDTAADPVVVEIHKRIMSDRTLGGLCQDIEAQVSSLDIVSADKESAVLTNSFDIMYRTSQEDISV